LLCTVGQKSLLDGLNEIKLAWDFSNGVTSQYSSTETCGVDALCPISVQICLLGCIFPLLCYCVFYSVAENIDLLNELKQQYKQQQKQPISSVSSAFLL